MENWELIDEFPGYSVSDAGRVRNDSSDRILAIRRNQDGICFVGMLKGATQRQRSLALLVAQAFVQCPEGYDYHIFDTPIHLDGDPTNNQAANLMWRPRWFAIKYKVQFQNPRVTSNPIVETQSGDTFDTIWQAAQIYGLLERDVVASCLNHEPVWPTRQRFRFIYK